MIFWIVIYIIVGIIYDVFIEKSWNPNLLVIVLFPILILWNLLEKIRNFFD